MSAVHRSGEEVAPVIESGFSSSRQSRAHHTGPPCGRSRDFALVDWPLQPPGPGRPACSAGVCADAKCPALDGAATSSVARVSARGFAGRSPRMPSSGVSKMRDRFRLEDRVPPEPHSTSAWLPSETVESRGPGSHTQPSTPHALPAEQSVYTGSIFFAAVGKRSSPPCRSGVGRAGLRSRHTACMQLLINTRHPARSVTRAGGLKIDRSYTGVGLPVRPGPVARRCSRSRPPGSTARRSGLGFGRHGVLTRGSASWRARACARAWAS